MAPWPLPKEYEHGSSVLWMAPDVELIVRYVDASNFQCGDEQDTLGVQTSGSNIQRHPGDPRAILQAAIARFKNAVFFEHFVPTKFHPWGAAFEPRADESRVFITLITIDDHNITDAQHFEHKLSDEQYELDISDNGHVSIKTVCHNGALHALNTLSQLFYAHTDFDTDVYMPCAPVHIKDVPLFPHRGLNLDIARNSITPKDAMRTLDAMSFNKLNRLHLHATDSQFWPLEIPKLPELALNGACDKSRIWTTADLREVQEYGMYRCIEVYVEIDMPGHTGSIHHSFPDLITGYNQQPWSPYAQEPPSGQLKLNCQDVSNFLATLLQDVLPRISPYASNFHVGGDEINTEAYELDPNVKSSSKDMIRPYLQSFCNHVLSQTSSHSLTPIAWEELLLDWNLDLPKNTIVQTWRSHSSLVSVVEKGYKALFGPRTHWYLDSGYGSWFDPDPSNPDTSTKPPYLEWSSPYKNWRQVYSYDPLKNIPEEHQHLVLGGEVHLWGELTDSVSLDGMLWPRVAAAAEILWKGKGAVCEDTTRRLAEMRERLVARGIGAGMVQMEWSLKNSGGSLQ